MATYVRSTRVAAPLGSVWDLQSTVEGLRIVTPDVLDLTVHAVEYPDGEVDERVEDGGDSDDVNGDGDDMSEADVLGPGTTLRMSIRPFGAGPRLHWTSVIVERRRGETSATFRDRMVEGPFPEWEHVHRFVSEDGGTRVVDRVEYELPGGALGRLASPFGVVGLEPVFRARHRRLREHFADRATADQG